MIKQPETRFKERVLPRLRRIPKSWWVKIQQVGIRGTPDVLGCIDGQFVAIELKQSAKAHVDTLQKHELTKICCSNGWAFIMFPENEEEVFTELEGINAYARSNQNGASDSKVHQRGPKSGTDCR